jgi:hypothetical protein
MKMIEEYNCLVNDVAGPTYEGHCHLDTAMLEAEDECQGNYGVSFEELLAEVSKTKKDLRIDAINRIRGWGRQDAEEKRSRVAW